MTGVILLLVAGTDLLSWRWIAGVTAAGALAAGWRLRRRIPDAYSVAQSIDRRLSLHDSLSTAVFFSAGRRRASEDIRRMQRAAADTLAVGVRLERAVPYTAPRSIYAMAALGIAASGLLAVRYGILRSLDLRPPLPAIVMDLFHPPAVRDQLAKDELDKRAAGQLREPGGPMDPADDAARRNRDAAAAGAAEAERAQRANVASPGEAGVSRQEREGRAGRQPGIEIPQAGEGKEGGEEQSGQPSSAKDGRPGQGRQGESSSLMDKFRDALANLMSRLNAQQQGAGSRQPAAAQQRAGGSQGQQQVQSRQGQQGQRGNRQGTPGAPGRGDREQNGADQNAQGMQRGEGQDAKDSREARSGIGSNDGDKSIHEAEQIAAMGKISEILGKRSETLTGEATVEVTSGEQKLKTAYSQQQASHADRGGEINRDEIPLVYHGFVERYFEQVRKMPPPAAPRTEPATHAISQ